jgi:hypothetical protein
MSCTISQPNRQREAEGERRTEGPADQRRDAHPQKRGNRNLDKRSWENQRPKRKQIAQGKM